MDYIKFLGTAGARFVVSQQLRKSGGIWLSLDDTNLLIDPGPGCLTRCLSSRPKLNPQNLDGIILSHRHLDHSNDINLMIEAMTRGGFNKKGIVFAPEDALFDDSVVLKYVRNYVDKIEVLDEKLTYKIGNISFSTPVKHLHHGVDTYGFNFYGKHHSFSFITDTGYFKNLESYYTERILLVNVVLKYKKKYIQHLSVSDVEKIISISKPKLTILNHFGITMVKSKPWEIAEYLSNKTGLNVIAASDGMKFNFESY